MMTLFGFILIGLSIFSLWIRKDPRIWVTLLGLGLISLLIAGNLSWIALLIILGWALLWILYIRKQRLLFQIGLFSLITLFSFGFKFHLFAGFYPIVITPKFLIGIETAIMGIFPLALIVPLARHWKDWTGVGKGLLIGGLGIALLAIVAVMSGAIHWQFKLPAFAGARYLSNLFLVTIPEEGFYRGFLQRELCRYLKNVKAGKFIALILASLLFTIAHIFWSPSLALLAFVFLASLLYGGVYLLTDKIESAIFCHFLLNFIHMTFFSYHAM